MSQVDLYKVTGEVLSGSDDIDTELIQKILANPETIFISEKITGPNNAKYEQVVNEEVEKYFVQAQDITTTIQNIKNRGDKVIRGK